MQVKADHGLFVEGTDGRTYTDPLIAEVRTGTGPRREYWATIIETTYGPAVGVTQEADLGPDVQEFHDNSKALQSWLATPHSGT